MSKLFFVSRFVPHHLDRKISKFEIWAENFKKSPIFHLENNIMKKFLFYLLLQNQNLLKFPYLELNPSEPQSKKRPWGWSAAPSYWSIF